MSSNSPSGLALVLVLTGALLSIVAGITQMTTGMEELRYVVVVGGAVQFTGWVLNSRRNRRPQR